MDNFEVKLFDGERLDEIGFNNLRLIQRPEDFCYGIDAVLLADFSAKKKQAGIVVDLGCGTGIVSLILSHKTLSPKIIGVEVQKEAYDMAVRNARINQLGSRLLFINCNIADFIKLKEDSGMQSCSAATLIDYIGKVDMVTSNPPYFISNGGIINNNECKTISRHETLGTLGDFVKAAGILLKDKGDFYMIHRPSRLVDIFLECRNNKLEPKEIQFISPQKDTIPNLVLIHSVKNGGKELKILKNLCVYDDFGDYTEEINKIYERFE